MSRIEVNGIYFNVATQGSGPAVTLLHGFTGCAHNWQPVAERWPGFQTIMIDLIGHGASDSPADPARYSMEACLEDLAAVLGAMRIARTALVGYSMGGR